MGRAGITAAAAALAMLGCASPAFGGYGTPEPEEPPPAPSGQPPATTVEARGNVFTGGLEFYPASVAVGVGDVVEWWNTDPYVPHTATEDHHLWRLSGDYGGTPFNPSGFGPDERRSRRFEAGTFNYFCEVHPEDMRGVVSVPVTLRRARPAAVKATWGTTALPQDQVFDVQRRRGKKWRTVLDGTRKLGKRFRSKPGATERFRARLRRADEPSQRSEWSPAVGLRLR